jgi:hypothetical protein
MYPANGACQSQILKKQVPLFLQLVNPKKTELYQAISHATSACKFKDVGSLWASISSKYILKHS